jgi:hypothetical protein
MQIGPLHLASQDISVVDDVSHDSVECVSQGSGGSDQDSEVIDRGDGYIEINGNLFYENWDEIDPPGSDDEPEIPHEEVVAYIRDLVEKRRAGK